MAIDDNAGRGNRGRAVLPATRRTMLRGLGLAAFAAGAGSASAGSGPAWIDQVFGNASYTSPTSASDQAKAKAEALNDLRPNTVPYRSEAMIDAIEAAINKYQAIAQKGGWPQIPGQKMLRPEDEDERIPVLRRRLAVTGELADAGSSYGYDDALEQAVKKFQTNHGLRVSGRVDKITLSALNVPVQERIEQLKLNLRRVRELMATRIEDRYILVNPAAFQLEAVERDEVQQRHRTIVGRVGRETPIVKANVRALNFFPMWHVPDSVATLDLIPKMRKEPEYLAKEKIRVLARDFNGPEIDPSTIDWTTATATQIKFRQDPGPQDALGLLRIDMPNSEGVYMHDTPMKPLFQQRARAFSAGCVRVEDVFKLGDWIARYESGWEQNGGAQAIIDGGQPRDVTLSRQIPVYFAYFTAWAEPGGAIQFRPDLYGRDGVATLVAGRDRDENEPAPPPQSLAP